MEIAATNYGAAILSIMAPDKDGKYANILLGHDSIDAVIHSPEPFLNTVVGRYANRIAQGEFTLEGKTYRLAINNGPNALHGGPAGFHTVVWDARQDEPGSVTFRYLSPNGEEGYPGNLAVVLRYTLTDDNALRIDYQATTDQATPVNLTFHGFFNLTGAGRPTPSVENHRLTLFADFYTPMDETSIPTGEIAPVDGTPMDFRTPHTVGERIDEPFQQLTYGAGYDHCYVLRKREAGALTLAAQCTDPASGRCLEMYTTEPGVQLYTGNWLNGFAGAHGATFPARSALCLEAQHFPDSPNKGHFPSTVLRPGEIYRQTTVYRFGIDSKQPYL